jgi:FkbM family methyltransferase
VQEIDFHRALFRPPGGHGDRQGGTIVDAGAHDGRMALDLAALPGTKLLAFEPLPSARARLATAFSARFGALPAHVTLRPEALGARAGKISLHVPRIRTPDGHEMECEEWASVAKDYAAIAAADPRVLAVTTHRVPVMRLDDLLLADLIAMKIDVEGGEAELIAGARETLVRCRPILSVEIEERHSPGSTRAVPAQLRLLGYEGFFEFFGEWRPVENFDADEMQRASPSPAEFSVGEPYVFTFYFVPPERRAELATLARLP